VSLYCLGGVLSLCLGRAAVETLRLVLAFEQVCGGRGRDNASIFTLLLLTNLPHLVATPWPFSGQASTVTLLPVQDVLRTLQPEPTHFCLAVPPSVAPCNPYSPGPRSEPRVWSLCAQLRSRRGRNHDRPVAFAGSNPSFPASSTN